MGALNSQVFFGHLSAAAEGGDLGRCLSTMVFDAGYRLGLDPKGVVEKLAEAASLKPATVREIMAGHIRKPPPFRLRAFARFLASVPGLTPGAQPGRQQTAKPKGATKADGNDGALLAQLGAVLVELQGKTEVMLEIVTKLAASATRLESRSPSTRSSPRPTKSTRRRTTRGQGGVWRRAEIVYADGATSTPAYLAHQAPMAKLAEACGCYMADWWALVTPFLGKDVELTIPGESRRKTAAPRAGEAVRVRLGRWVGPGGNT